jgi:hypothetical protein
MKYQSKISNIIKTILFLSLILTLQNVRSTNIREKPSILRINLKKNKLLIKEKSKI